MADFPAYTDRLMTGLDNPAPHYGRTTGFAVAPPHFWIPIVNDPAALDPAGYLAVDSFASGGAVPPPASPTDNKAILRLEMGGAGFDWFEKVHLLPRSKINFGNIVTNVDRLYELFSAFRLLNTSLTSIVNGTPGIVLPDQPLPVTTLRPFNDFPGAGSLPLAPAKQIVRALKDGPATFDTSIDFVFSLGGTLSLLIKGSRIALVAALIDGDYTETLEWKTSILEKYSGNEQRIAERKNPRQILDVVFFLTDLDRQRMQAILFDWQSKQFAIPAWTEQMKLTTAIVANTTTVAVVDSTTDVDLRIGQLAMVFQDARTFDVIRVTAKTSTTVTFESNILSAYPATGCLVVPVLVCLAQRVIAGSRPPYGLQRLRARFRSVDNNTGVPTGDTSGYSSYLGKVLLDDCNSLNGEFTETFEREIFEVDNETGLFLQDSLWDRNKHGLTKGFVTRTRAQLFKVRRLLYALRGRQISFYIPTFIEDLTVQANLSSGSNLMRIENIGYDRFIQDREPKKTFKITFTDGTSLVRIVSSSTEISGSVEELTLNTTWPANRTVAEVVRVQFYEKVRIDTDAITIRHSPTIGKARIFFPIKTVFD